MAKRAENNELKITGFDTLKKYSRGAVIELPPFSESQPFVARVKRPELLDVVTHEIPNELLGVAWKLFNPEEQKAKEKDPIEEFSDSEEYRDVLRCIAKATLVEPTLEEVEEAGMKLSMVQLISIYEYVNTGVENLKFFRQ